MPLRRALARARATRPPSPSTPSTLCARRARASEKLPSPQYRSSTQESAAELQQSCRRRHQRAIDRGVDLNEVGRQKFDFQRGFRQRVEQARRRLGQRLHAVDATRAAGRSARRAAARRRAGWPDPRAEGAASTRRTSATASSPIATSICGSRSRIESCVTSADSGMISPSSGGASTSQRVRFAIRCERRSRKPTSARSLRRT